MERTFAFVHLAAMCLVNYVPRSVGFLRERFGGGVRGQRLRCAMLGT